MQYLAQDAHGMQASNYTQGGGGGSHAPSTEAEAQIRLGLQTFDAVRPGPVELGEGERALGRISCPNLDGREAFRDVGRADASASAHIADISKSLKFLELMLRNLVLHKRFKPSRNEVVPRPILPGSGIGNQIINIQSWDGTIWKQ